MRGSQVSHTDPADELLSRRFMKDEKDLPCAPDAFQKSDNGLQPGSGVQRLHPVEGGNDIGPGGPRTAETRCGKPKGVDDGIAPA